MSMTKEQVKTYLELDNLQELNDILKSCQLDTSDNTEYEESEVDLIEDYQNFVVNQGLEGNYHDFISEGKNPQEALNLIKENHQLKRDKNDPQYSGELGKKTPIQSSSLSLLKMIELAQDEVGQVLSLSRVGEYLKLTGLTEKDNYTKDELDKFILTCTSIIKQGKSYSEVSQMNGIPEAGQSILEKATQFSDQQIVSWGSAVNESMEKQQQALAGVVTRMHLQGLAHYLGSEAMQQQADRTRQRILAQTDLEIEQLEQEYEAWENNKRQQWGLNGTNSVNALPGSMENS